MSPSDEGKRADATTERPSGSGGGTSGTASATTERRPTVTSKPDAQDAPAATSNEPTRPMKPGAGKSKNGSPAESAAARAVAAGGSATKPATPSPAPSRPAVQSPSANKALVTNTPGSSPVSSSTSSPANGGSSPSSPSPTYAPPPPAGYAPTNYEQPREPQTVAPSPSSAPAASAAGPRTARLTIASVDPWSVLKLSFLLSVAFGIALVIASVVLWSVLNGMGVFESINSTLGDIGGAEDRFDIYSYIGLGRVVSLSVVVAVVNVVLITALSTIGGFLYNLGAGLVGGLHVTLSDD